MLIEDVAREFFVYLDAEKGCSPATIEAYGSDLKLFLGFLRTREVRAEVGSVTTEVLGEYLADMSARGLSASTRGRRLYSLRSLWHYLEVTEKVTENPCRRVSALYCPPQSRSSCYVSIGGIWTQLGRQENEPEKKRNGPRKEYTTDRIERMGPEMRERLIVRLLAEGLENAE